MLSRLTTRSKHGDAMLCDRLQGIGICLNADVERVAQYEDELEAQRWISVEERLPEEPMEYIVMIKGGANATTLMFDGKLWFEEDAEEWRTYYAVTHWMPLPEPPEDLS